MPTTAADREHQFLLEDFLNAWLTENPETLPGIRESKAKTLFKVPDEGPDSVVLHILCQRYALFPKGTKRKVQKDWAATEAATMRAMAIHALLLTRRSNGGDVDQVIEDSLNEAMQQDPNSPGSSMPASETEMDVDMVGDSDAPENPEDTAIMLDPVKPMTIAKDKVTDPSQMETQLQYWESCETPDKPKSENNRQADKAMRPPIQSVKPELPIDLLPGLSAQIQTNLSEPQVDLVQAQRQVREKTRLEAAAKALAKDAENQGKPKGKGRGRGGRGRRQAAPKEQEQKEQEPKEQEPMEHEPMEQEPKEQEPKEQEPEKQEPQKPNKQEKQALAKKQPKSKSTPEDSPWAAQWKEKEKELLEAGIPIPDTFHGQTKSFTIQPWYENQLYVIKSFVPYNGIKINNKNGSSLAQRKYGGWQNAWEYAQIVAGWMPASRLYRYLAKD
ncbi:KIF21B [Symbiodinium sp. CCMP2592]|nr:KIF21B [Symbiodinium sp. CCMP2592]